MTQYNGVNVKLSYSQLVKLNLATKNFEIWSIMLMIKLIFGHELTLIDRKVSDLRKAFAKTLKLM